MCTGTRIKHVYQGACPWQAVTCAEGTAEHQRVPCRRHGSKACLIYKETTLSKNLRNRSCKRPLSLYTEPRKRRLPKTRIHIVNKQTFSISTTIIDHLRFISTTTNTRYLPQPFDHLNQRGNATSPAERTER